MTAKMRFYKDEDDFWRIREFLREVFLLNSRQELSWQVARLDYWRFFINGLNDHYDLHEAIYIWEAFDGRIAAVMVPDGRGNAFLNMHPQLRTAELELDMIAAAERYLASEDAEGHCQITIWAHQKDELRKCLLMEQAYVQGDWPEYQRGRSLSIPIPSVPLAEGYMIRALGDASDIPARSWVSWRAFHPDEPAENYMGHYWYADIQRCPMYRRDLDLVAVAPDGELAAFTTVWYDDVTRTGCFEPVGTAPDHQRKGLGKAIMTEGLRRLKHMGAVHATVAGYSDAANALYASVMSPDYLLYERWHKQLSN